MENQANKTLLTIIITALITATLVTAGILWVQKDKPSIQSPLELSCIQSGGEFKNNECKCPEVDGELMEYEGSTGYCMTAFGIPGGNLGEQAQKLQELEMMKDNQTALEYQSYSSENYNLTFNYPKGWTPNESTVQLDVQPPEGMMWTNYFTITKLESTFGPKAYFDEIINSSNYKKADFKIAGSDVYKAISTGDAGTFFYFYFANGEDVYNLTSFESVYDLPEVQGMMKSLKFIITKKTIEISRMENAKCLETADPCPGLTVTTEIEAVEPFDGDSLTGHFYIRAYLNGKRVAEKQITQNFNRFDGDGGTPIVEDTERILNIKKPFNTNFYLEYSESIPILNDSGHILHINNRGFESGYNGQIVHFFYSQGKLSIDFLQ
ncbi:hypothetical protein IPJ72_02240 [Candidatus Peregrinibacteria bacterium]|nr:MAG: hypothetical protein IPJ72_02240 [Candidatus Peregrinibacteria bacterium]